MKSLIKAIKLNEKFADYTFQEKNILNNLTKVNLFVGPNNSGKSRFLRLLASMVDFEFSPEHSIDDIDLVMDEFKKQVIEINKAHGIASYGGINTNAINKLT